MNNISSMSQLQQEIKLLRERNAVEEKTIREDLTKIQESFKPGNIVHSFVKQQMSSGIVSEILSSGLAFLTNKFLFNTGSKGSIIRTFMRYLFKKI